MAKIEVLKKISNSWKKFQNPHPYPNPQIAKPNPNPKSKKLIINSYIKK